MSSVDTFEDQRSNGTAQARLFHPLKLLGKDSQPGDVDEFLSQQILQNLDPFLQRIYKRRAFSSCIISTTVLRSLLPIALSS